MQSLKSLFGQSKSQKARIATRPTAGKPTPLTPAEMKAVAGGLPRGGFAIEAVTPQAMTRQ